MSDPVHIAREFGDQIAALAAAHEVEAVVVVIVPVAGGTGVAVTLRTPGLGDEQAAALLEQVRSHFDATAARSRVH